MLDITKVKQELIPHLIEKQWGFVDNLLSEEMAHEILQHLDELQIQEQFHKSRIGAPGHLQTISSIRGDHIYWLDESKDDEFTSRVFSVLKGLQELFKEELLISLKSIETHFAIYPEGHGYDVHYDRQGQSNSRELTFVFYLNKSWSKLDGGEIVLYDHEGSEIESVSPNFNRLIVFKSESFPHKVNKALRPRKSLTGWFRSTL